MVWVRLVFWVAGKMGLVPLTTPAHITKQRRTAPLVAPPVTSTPSSPKSPIHRLRTLSGEWKRVLECASRLLLGKGLSEGLMWLEPNGGGRGGDSMFI